MFDETTAASIVSALRRWTGSSSADDPSSPGDPSSPTVVQSGLRWSEALRGLSRRGSIELNPLIENLDEFLWGGRVLFEPAAHSHDAPRQPTIDLRKLSTESHTPVSGRHDLSTPLTALRPDAGALHTVLKLSPRSILDGCAVPVRSWATDRLYGTLHVSWDRRPRANPDELRWRLLILAQLIADTCAQDERQRSETDLVHHIAEDLRSSHDAWLVVDGDSIIFANEAAARLLESTERRIKQAKYADLVKPSPRAQEESTADPSRKSRSLALPDGGIRFVDVFERVVDPARPELRLVRLYESDAARRVRQRAWLETLSEAVWQIDLREPVIAEKVTLQSVRASLESARLALWNQRMTELVTDVSPTAGESLEMGDVLAFLGEGILKDFVRGGLRLRDREHKVRCRDGSWRHFVVNLQGVRRDGHLIHVIGSTLETTAYAEVEQQTVSSLEKQREELGRELHDVVGQLLTGIRLLSSNLARDTSLPPEKIRLHATRVSQMAEEAHLNLRQINRGLSAAHLQHVRLDDALHDLAEFVGSMPSVECTFDCDEYEDELEPEKKLQIYRIAQESVNNALKHASASLITLQWKRNGAGFMLVVSDNGVGFDEHELNGKTLGLHSMRYRARVVGAELAIQSTPGAGTSIQCILPA